jgi:carbamoyltransferase
VLQERAAELFGRAAAEPVHAVRPRRRTPLGGSGSRGRARGRHRPDPDRDAADEPLLAALLTAFEARTNLPVLVNTSLNTAGRPMVDSPGDALELFGSTPVDLLVLGPHLVRRAELASQ